MLPNGGEAGNLRTMDWSCRIVLLTARLGTECNVATIPNLEDGFSDHEERNSH
jgi:hypothetical protein